MPRVCHVKKLLPYSVTSKSLHKKPRVLNRVFKNKCIKTISSIESEN